MNRFIASVCLNALIVLATQATAQTVVTLAPTADTYTQQGTPTTNYGTQTTVLVRRDSAGTLTRGGYFQFNISGLPAGTITSAVLRLFGSQDQGGAGITLKSHGGTAASAWSETALTYNNAATLSGVDFGSPSLATIAVSPPPAAWYSWDVTSYVASRRSAGHATIGVGYTTNDTYRSTFNSKEATTNRPQLVVTIGSSPPATNFAATANALQNSTHTRFISSNGNYYKEDNGSSTRFHYWWNAHALDALADAYERTRDPVYATRMKTLVRGIRSSNGNTYDNNFIDDLSWLGLASVRSYELTDDVEYLNVAEFVWVEIKKGYSNGAISWEMGCHPNCKNAISNNPPIVLGARLLSIRANSADLQLITSVYDWVKSRLVDPANGAIWDNVNLSNNTVDRAVYSYNQGLFIGAALEMYKLTGNAMYMNDAVRTADYVVNTRSPGGMIFGDETGGGDGGLFKGICVRYLALLAREGNIPATTRTRYINAIKFNATRLDTQGIRRPDMLIGANWSVAPGTVTQLSMQLSGLMTIEAAVIVDQPIVYRHYQYHGRPVPLPNGSYTLAALAARGMANDDITSITVPPGASVTLYENDNFTGASIVVTANDPLLANSGWNDRASSIVVGR